MSQKNSSDLNSFKTLAKICLYCDKPFARRDRLMRHINSKHPGKPLPVIPEKIKPVSKPSAPAEKKEDNERKFQCVVCGKGYDRMSRLEKHLRVNHLQTSTANQGDSLRPQVAEEGQDGAKQPTSDVVGKQPSKDGLKKVDKNGSSKPVKIRTRKRESPTPCPYCEKILSRTDTLKPHILSQHPGKKVPIKIVSTPVKGASGDRFELSSLAGSKSCSVSVSLMKSVEKKAFKMISSPLKSGKKMGAVSSSPKKVDKKVSVPKSTSAKSKQNSTKDKKANKDTSGAKVAPRLDWRKVWSSGNPVFVKFNFTKPKKRKRTHSELSLDLETLFNEDIEKKPRLESPTVPSPTPISTNPVRNIFSVPRKDKLGKLKSPQKASRENIKPCNVQHESRKPAGRISSLGSPSLIELHRRSLDNALTPARKLGSPPKKKIEIIQSITYK